MARFEKDGRFVELWLADGETWSELWRREGAIGEPAAPERVELQHVFSAERQCMELLGEHLRGGWTRVTDPERELPLDEESVDPRLAAALRAGDPDAVLVLGDVLEQQGHPRGALIAIQRALEDRPDAELAARAAQILEDHADTLLGPLAAHVGERGDHHDPVLVLAWRRGFIDRARIDGFHDRGASEQLLWELLRHPSARFLRELEIGCHHPGDQDNTLMADLICTAAPAPPLRRLFLGDFDHTGVDQIDISRAPLGDLRGLGARYPLLEDVVLKGTGDVELGADLGLPRAKHFAIRTSSLRRATLEAVVRAAWPALEDLELWFGDPEYGADCDASDIPKVMAIAAPNLRALRLMNADFTDELVEHVVAAPLARRLEILDLSLGTLTADGADRLIADVRVFERLQQLVVFECVLDDAVLARMRAAGLPVDETPCSPAHATCLGWRQTSRASDYPRWRRPRLTQKSDRFVSESE